MHKLVITDTSSTFRSYQTLYFSTPEGAKGWAADRGSFYGFITYQLDGQEYRPDEADKVLRENPIAHGESIWNARPGYKPA